MYKVEFYDYSGLGKKLFGEVHMDGDKITFHGFNEALRIALDKIMVFDDVLTPADGMKYLQALKIYFTGLMLRASDVMEG